jgi:hypothetical protein
MTLSPEEHRRAAAIWAESDLADTQEEAVAIIAAAVRQAEETAVQRVLAAIEGAHDHVATIAIMRIRENDPTLLKDTSP